VKPSDYIRRGWCQNASAQDDQGRLCDATSSLAQQWCLVGSVRAAYPEDAVRRNKVFDKLFCQAKTYGLSSWNDNPDRTQQEVLAVLEAIGE
jgi:hypothetical protein